MPSYKELSKIKIELIAAREAKIKRSLTYQQNNLYESLINDFVKVAKDKIEGKEVSIYKLQTELKKQYSLYFPEVMSDTVKASSDVTNLNHRYFSTLVESERLDEIKTKTFDIINRTLGVTDKGKLKQNGFIDKVIANKDVQKRFGKEVNIILDGNPDIVLMQQKLKELITGSKESTGLLERYYRTFARDLISKIDATGSLIYANELELNHFYYAGGVILTTRSFCKHKNGKIFTRKEAAKWSKDPFIKEMYSGSGYDYDPLIDKGGFGCRHSLNWITEDLAKAKA